MWQQQEGKTFILELKWIHDKVILMAQDKTFKSTGSPLPVYLVQLGQFINVNNYWESNGVCSCAHCSTVQSQWWLVHPEISVSPSQCQFRREWEKAVPWIWKQQKLSCWIPKPAPGLCSCTCINKCLCSALIYAEFWCKYYDTHYYL